MKLVTKEILKKLQENGRTSAESGSCLDMFPVAKFFTPDANATWLIVKVDPSDPDLAFGLCDLGQGFPELAYVRISELEKLKGPSGLSVERDRDFRAEGPMSAYVEAARTEQRITEDAAVITTLIEEGIF